MAEDYVYIGTKPCGCITAGAIDRPEYKKATAKSVAEFITNGYQVSRVLGPVTLAHCMHGTLKEQLTPSQATSETTDATLS